MFPIVLHHPVLPTRYRTLQREDVARIERLHVEVVKEGRLTHELPEIEQMRAARQADLAQLDPGVKRLMNPHIYHVSLSERLWSLKQELIAAAKTKAPDAGRIGEERSETHTGG
jgi:nicotinate phosphoribosyltransferase